MNVLTYLNSLRPALPLSVERKGERGECLPMSNAELRRFIDQKAVLLNGETDWKWDEEAPTLVWQLVFFPKSTKPKGNTKFARRTTLI